MSIKRDIELLYELGSLRFIQRSWKHFLNGDFQNLTDHHFRVVWLALLIAKHEQKGDHEKIMKMALVHDVPESRAGDLDYVSRQYATRDEEKAANEIFEDTSLRDEMVSLWKEYEKKECIEAKIVKDADNLDVDLELIEQGANGNSLKDQWKEGRKIVRGRLYTATAKKLFDEIWNSNPHDWHLNAKNRFKVGDWKK